MARWTTAEGGEVCFGCGETQEEGWDVYQRGNILVCEPCKEDEDLDSDDDYPIDGVGFADPGGRSSLRAETESNPRNLPCPTCGEENRLTPLDKAAGYQCNACADRAEGFGG